MFLISFIAAVTIFSLSVGAVLMWGGTMGNLSETSSKAASEPAYIPDEQQSITVLAIGCRERGDPAAAFALIRLDAPGRKIYVSALPPETLATVNIKTDTLTGFYDYGGAQMAEEAVQNAYGVYINRYVRVSMSAFCTLFDLLGGVEFAPPYDAAFRVQENLSPPSAGKQLLDGKRAYELFAAPGTDELDQVHLQTQILGAFIDQHLTSRAVKASESLFDAMINRVDTDVTRYDYSFRVEALEAAASSQDKVKEVLVQGENTSEGFVPERGTLAEFSAEKIE